MTEASVRWVDMVDPVYTLARLVDIDPDEVKIAGIAIMMNRLIVYYEENGNQRYVSKPYDL